MQPLQEAAAKEREFLMGSAGISMRKAQVSGSPALARALGLWFAIAVIAGGMIGQSVFLVASDMARALGSPTEVLAAWLCGGIVVLCGSFCYAELGAALPRAGGDYIYLSEGYGSLWGFLYGWASAVLMRPASCAFIAAGLLRFASFNYPSLSNPLFTWTVPAMPGVQPFQGSLSWAQLLAAGVLLVVTAINCLGVRTGGWLQVFLTAFKVAVLVAIVALGLTMGNRNGTNIPAARAISSGGLARFLTALVPVMAAYSGFNYLGHLGAEISNPRRNLPRAAIFGVSLVITVYLLVNWTYLRVLGFAQVAKSQHVASDTVATILGGTGARWLTIALIVSALGSLHANFLSGPRVTYAMAERGFFFSFAKRIDPSFRTPINAVLLQGAAAILMVLTGTYQELYSLLIFSSGMFYALTASSLIRLRFTQPHLPRPYRAWGYPLPPLVFGAVYLSISLHLVIAQPIRSGIGLLIIMLGIPFFRVWSKRGGRRAADLPPQ